MTFDVEKCREHFPGLKRDQVYLDNAGGSQTLGTVIKSISDYLSNSNVQLGASYLVGRESTSKYTEGCRAAARYVNAHEDEVVIGASTTQLYRNISFSLDFKSGDEILLCKINHEANSAPWAAIAERVPGVQVKWWEIAPSSNPQLVPEDIKRFLTPRTKLVALPHTSNILGTLHDIKAITKVVRETAPDALVCVDGVAYAPHRQVDVADLGVDFYSFSWYKVYGPHIALLFASRKAQNHLRSFAHYFNASDSLEDKLGLAAGSYELVQSIPSIVEYMGAEGVTAFFKGVSQQEEKLASILLDFLRARDDVTICGEPTADPAKRVATISFLPRLWDSRDLVEAIEGRSKYACRWGYFYADRLCGDILGAGPSGVVRVSMVHYNTEEEVRGFVKELEHVLDEKKH